MKNLNLVIVIIAAIAVLGVGAYTLSQNSSKTDSVMQKTEPKEKVVMEKKEDGAMQKTDDKMMAGARYVEYSKAALENAASTRRVLFFYASWCPTCRPADVNFKENESKIPADVTLIRVNYNDPETNQEEKDLAKKYGITYQHTYVQIDSTGKEITKWNGGQINELLSNIK